MSELARLGRLCAQPLAQLRELLSELPEEHYRRSGPGCSAAPGSQVRHLLEVGECLVVGWESGRVDYDRRPRDPGAERDPERAARRLEALSSRLLACTRNAGDAPLRVRQDELAGVGAVEGAAREPCWAPSSRSRELRFLLSHTVHHCAILALLFELRGLEPPKGFGVAPATLQARGELVLPEEPPCAP